MLPEERTNNVGHPECSPLVRFPKNASSNGIPFGTGVANIDGSNGSISVDGVRTYKRRKQMRMGSKSNLQEEPGQLVDKKRKQPHYEVLRNDSHEQNGLSRIDGPLLTQGPADCLHGHWRKAVLGILSQSTDDGEGSLRGCILDAVASSPFCSGNMCQLHSASEQTAHAQDSLSCHRDRGKEHRSVNSDVSQNEPNNQATVNVKTELCQRVFYDVLVSEKFNLLFKLLCENFQGIKVESFTDFRFINSRMGEGAYEQCPRCFCSDIQWVWRKFENIGTEMISLARGLSDFSNTSYTSQFQGVVNGICGERKHEAEDSGLDKGCSCRLCGAKPDGKDYLVCDSCEEMYHVSCIEPAVEEIPPRNWYCANCTIPGIESPHENCVVCERLKDCPTQVHAERDGKESMEEDIICNLEEKSVSSVESEESGLGCSKRERLINRPCKLCGGHLKEGQKFKVCEHEFCPFRVYHVHCLTSEQLKYHGPFWYCPSCLCRTCLTNKEDDKILICDGCDHAYHTYCAEPPLTSIPKGKWFCEQCEKKKNCEKK